MQDLKKEVRALQEKKEWGIAQKDPPRSQMAIEMKERGAQESPAPPATVVLPPREKWPPAIRPPIQDETKVLDGLCVCSGDREEDNGAEAYTPRKDAPGITVDPKGEEIRAPRRTEGTYAPPPPPTDKPSAGGAKTRRRGERERSVSTGRKGEFRHAVRSDPKGPVPYTAGPPSIRREGKTTFP